MRTTVLLLVACGCVAAAALASGRPAPLPPPVSSPPPRRAQSAPQPLSGHNWLLTIAAGSSSFQLRQLRLFLLSLAPSLAYTTAPPVDAANAQLPPPLHVDLAAAYLNLRLGAGHSVQNNNANDAGSKEEHGEREVHVSRGKESVTSRVPPQPTLLASSGTLNPGAPVDLLLISPASTASASAHAVLEAVGASLRCLYVYTPPPGAKASHPSAVKLHLPAAMAAMAEVAAKRVLSANASLVNVTEVEAGATNPPAPVTGGSPILVLRRRKGGAATVTSYRTPGSEAMAEGSGSSSAALSSLLSSPAGVRALDALGYAGVVALDSGRLLLEPGPSSGSSGGSLSRHHLLLPALFDVLAQATTQDTTPASSRPTIYWFSSSAAPSSSSCGGPTGALEADDALFAFAGSAAPAVLTALHRSAKVGSSAATAASIQRSLRHIAHAQDVGWDVTSLPAALKEAGVAPHVTLVPHPCPTQASYRSRCSGGNWETVAARRRHAPVPAGVALPPGAVPPTTVVQIDANGQAATNSPHALPTLHNYDLSSNVTVDAGSVNATAVRRFPPPPPPVAAAGHAAALRVLAELEAMYPLPPQASPLPVAAVDRRAVAGAAASGGRAAW